MYVIFLLDSILPIWKQRHVTLLQVIYDIKSKDVQENTLLKQIMLL